MTDTIRAEFYSAEDRADIQLVEGETPTPYANALAGAQLTVVKPRWSIVWHFCSDEPDRVERFPSEHEARVHYMNLLAQNGVSP